MARKRGPERLPGQDSIFGEELEEAAELRRRAAPKMPIGGDQWAWAHYLNELGLIRKQDVQAAAPALRALGLRGVDFRRLAGEFRERFLVAKKGGFEARPQRLAEIAISPRQEAERLARTTAFILAHRTGGEMHQNAEHLETLVGLVVQALAGKVGADRGYAMITGRPVPRMPNIPKQSEKKPEITFEERLRAAKKLADEMAKSRLWVPLSGEERLSDFSPSQLAYFKGPLILKYHASPRKFTVVRGGKAKAPNLEVVEPLARLEHEFGIDTRGLVEHLRQKEVLRRKANFPLVKEATEAATYPPADRMKHHNFAIVAEEYPQLHRAFLKADEEGQFRLMWNVDNILDAIHGRDFAIIHGRSIATDIAAQKAEGKQRETGERQDRRRY